MRNRRKQPSQLEQNIEKHVCKICGQSMGEHECRMHMRETGHNEFRPQDGGVKQNG